MLASWQILLIVPGITSVGGAKPTASIVPQEPCGVLNANTVTGHTMFSVQVPQQPLLHPLHHHHHHQQPLQHPQEGEVDLQLVARIMSLLPLHGQETLGPSSASQ